MSGVEDSTQSESGLNSPPELTKHRVVPVTSPPGYTRQDFLLDHTWVLFRNMIDWSTDELHWAPEYLVPYLGRLRRTGYPTLHTENLLWPFSYWASVFGMMERVSDELLAVNLILWESLNSHFE